jgi:hypothetical protein
MRVVVTGVIGNVGTAPWSVRSRGDGAGSIEASASLAQRVSASRLATL